LTLPFKTTPEINFVEDVKQLLIRAPPEWIQILPKGSDEQYRILGDNGDFGSEVSESNSGNVDGINVNCPSVKFYEAEEGRN